MSRATSSAKPDTDYGINKSGYVIHGAIHKARPEVKCVLHTHTRAGIAAIARDDRRTPAQWYCLLAGTLPAAGGHLRLHLGFEPRHR